MNCRLFGSDLIGMREKTDGDLSPCESSDLPLSAVKGSSIMVDRVMEGVWLDWEGGLFDDKQLVMTVWSK